MSRQLVVTADDLGLSAGVNAGIAQAHDSGIVTAASLVPNGPAFEDAVGLLGARPALSCGVHLNLTDGVPVSRPGQVPSLLDDQGRFLGYRTFTLRLLSGRLDRNELITEIHAQIGRILDAGLVPVHLNGHRHVHLLPVLFDLVAEAARRYRITTVRCPAALGERGAPAGVKSVRALGLAGFGRLHYGRLVERGLSSADCFLGALTFNGGESIEDAAGRLADLPEGTTEWMVHPGEVDSELMFQDAYLWPRQAELAFLVGPDARRAVSAAGLTLANWSGAPRVLPAPRLRTVA